MSFQIERSKIIWPKEQYDSIKANFGNGVGFMQNDLLEITERAGILSIPDDSIFYNELLSGELGIDLIDVFEAIHVKVEREQLWTTFAEYKNLRVASVLTWDEFVNYFQIESE